MAAVMSDIDAISKSRTNEQQRFKFRGIDDIYNELHKVLANHKVFTVPCVIDERTEERTSKSGNNIIYRVIKMQYTFYAEDGSSVCAIVIGEGMDSGDKACNKAMSIAHKYALLQTFCIPTEDEKDPDATTPETSKPRKNKQQAPTFEDPLSFTDNGVPQGQSIASEETISPDQRRRLFAIMTSAGKTSDQVKVILSAYGYDSSKDIKKADYEDICNKISNMVNQ